MHSHKYASFEDDFALIMSMNMLVWMSVSNV